MLVFNVNSVTDTYLLVWTQCRLDKLPHVTLTEISTSLAITIFKKTRWKLPGRTTGCGPGYQKSVLARIQHLPRRLHCLWIFVFQSVFLLWLEWTHWCPQCSHGDVSCDHAAWNGSAPCTRREDWHVDQRNVRLLWRHADLLVPTKQIIIVSSSFNYVFKTRSHGCLTEGVCVCKMCIHTSAKCIVHSAYTILPAGCLGLWCPCFLRCQVTSGLGESHCLLMLDCIIGGLISPISLALRSTLRERYRIQVQNNLVTTTSAFTCTS